MVLLLKLIYVIYILSVPLSFSSSLPLSSLFVSFLRLIEKYIISLDPPPQPQPYKVSAYRALAHGSLPSLTYGA